MESMRRWASCLIIATGFVLTSTVLTSISHAAGTAPATDSAGPFKTSNAEYRMKASVDADILANRATEIWARVYWPKDLSDIATGKAKRHPLLMFLHGNHGTCGSGTAPRNDSSCEYTNEGTCPDGYVVTPNHEGYNYAAENLASWGYIVVSINANRGITCGGGGSEDWGLILARGRLVLKHLQLWSEWAANGGAPTTLGAADQFVGAVDLTNVGLMGHSRGGEGVRAALNLFRDPGSLWPSRIPGLDIKAIYEIGAVDGQSNRVLDAPSVAWNQLLPLCDGDVSDLQGRLPFERMMSHFSAKGEAESRPSTKALTMVWGANHNYFNTEWQTSDSWGCTGSPTHKPIFDENKTESAEQKAIALQSMSAFFRSNVGADKSAALGQSFDPAYVLPQVFASQGRVDRDFIPGLELSKVFRVDDFTSPAGTNPSGAKNASKGITLDHDLTSEPPMANVSWLKSGADHYLQTNFAEGGKSADISAFDYLDFRAGRRMDDAEKELSTPIDFSVQLVDADDKLSTPVAIANYTRLQGPPNDSAEVMQTIRVPVADFGSFDLKKVRGVRFVFDKSAKGQIRLAHVRFGVTTEKITTFGAMSLAALQKINRAAALLNGNALPMDLVPAETTPADLILPDPEDRSRLSTPFDLPRPTVRNSSTERRASWMKPRKVKKSWKLSGATGIELTVEAISELFPVMDAAMVLNIENHLFPIASFPSNGKTYSITFTIPEEAYSLLPKYGRAQVQYGVKAPSRIWELPEFSKSNMDENMEIE